ncbi:hypothetical protein [Erwinia sp. Leaf53]|uniref:hypothetical protein n=1 Tax=Erwinia sp. Leaf53 TaxID=1736225 RepID=UPI0006F442B1|nr:hypothetical protein [Erwinia sp. Leaf53]KQN64799.1 hypothetical protein ASF13_00035 [Erwinia sp. Leaf53]
MGWPLPDIPEKSAIPAPRYGLWFIILAAMLISGSLLALFIGRFSAYAPVLLYGVLPAFLLWLCIFGIVLNRHDQSGASACAWHEETQETKSQWQQWSREQVAVVGNILLTPEDEGVSSILGPLSDIPAFPQKARPLWGDKQNLASRLNMIDEALGKQASGYGHHLYAIYVVHSSALYRETIRAAVFKHWLLEPVFISSVDQIQELNPEHEISGLTLILCLQHWPDNRPQKSSEMISALLICSPGFLRENNYSLLAGIGRMMPLSQGSLHDDLAMLFEYNRLNVNELEHVWLSGESANNAVALSIYAESHQWLLPEKKPVHYIDLTFGPPGELAFGVSLSMMVEAARSTSKDQLIIYQKPQSSGWLCLITRELFS